MKNKKLILLFVFLPFFVMAQQTENLSHYVFPEFHRGVVLLKNGVRNNAMLNYNSLSEEMVFEENGQMLAIGKVLLPQIDTVFIADRKFIRQDDKFVEIRIDKPEIALYIEHKCRVTPPGKPAPYGGTSQTSSTTSYSSIMTEGRLYDLKLPGDYKITPYTVYRLKRNGKWQSFSNVGQLKKLYRDKKDMVDTYLKNNDFDIKKPENVVNAIKSWESL